MKKYCCKFFSPSLPPPLEKFLTVTDYIKNIFKTHPNMSNYNEFFFAFSSGGMKAKETEGPLTGPE